MTAARLRRIGTKGLLVDPGEVAAVMLTYKPAGVAVFLSSGVLIQVLEASEISKDACDADDVAKVHHQLVARTT